MRRNNRSALCGFQADHGGRHCRANARVGHSLPIYYNFIISYHSLILLQPEHGGGGGSLTSQQNFLLLIINGTKLETCFHITEFGKKCVAFCYATATQNQEENECNLGSTF